MKKVALIVCLLALVLLPVYSASAAISKTGWAFSNVTSQAKTTNSISINNTNSQQLFDALTGSAGLTATTAEIQGSQPASLTSTGLGTGAATAFGKNRGKVNNVFLPVIQGASGSAISMGSQSSVSIQ